MCENITLHAQKVLSSRKKQSSMTAFIKMQWETNSTAYFCVEFVIERSI